MSAKVFIFLEALIQEGLTFADICTLIYTFFQQILTGPRLSAGDYAGYQ